MEKHSHDWQDDCFEELVCCRCGVSANFVAAQGYDPDVARCPDLDEPDPFALGGRQDRQLDYERYPGA